MTSSVSLDLELENYGWSESLITRKSYESYESIVDKTMSFSIFLIIYIYCLVEFLFDFIINDLKKDMFIPRISLFQFNAYFVSPRLITK